MFKQMGYQFSCVVSALLLSATAVATSSNQSTGNAFAKSADKPASAVVERSESYDDLKLAQQEFTLANDALNKAVTGKKVEDISAEEIANVVSQAERAASHGSAAAYNLLYTIYFSGWGVPVDNLRAVEYLRHAAVMGDVSAKLNYAILLYQGIPQVAKDSVKACGFFKELIEDSRVSTIVSYFMGMIEFRGECGRPADEKFGMALIQVAADGGMGEAELMVAMNFENGWTVPADMSAALAWYEKAAGHGQPRAVWRVGVAYENAEFRERNVAKAIEHYQRAASAGDTNALVSLALKYRSGDGIERNVAMAKELFEQAASMGNAQANMELARMYLNGEGTPVDVVQARVLYAHAIEMGADAQPSLLQAIESKMSAKQLHDSQALSEKVALAH